MKNTHFLEKKPVSYSAAGIKSMSFKMDKGSKCFIPHWHDRLEIIRVRDGEMCVECARDAFRLQKDCLTVFPPQKMHSGHTSECAVEYDVIMLDVRSFYNDVGLSRAGLSAIFDGLAVFESIITDSEIIECFDEIFESNKSASIYTVSSVYRLVGLLYERALLKMKEKSESAFIQRVSAYFYEHIAEEIDMDRLSALFGYTKSHFCRKFKAATGVSSMEYLGAYRLDVASKLLKSTDMQISEIAEKCGFSDSNYFSRSFRARYDLSPREYRKIHADA